MRRRGSLLLALAMLFAAVGFSYGAAEAGDDADALCRNVSVCLDAPLSAQGAQVLFSQEMETAFAVWGERKDQRICDPDLGRSTQADVLCFLGSPELALPQARLDPEDGSGCIIGEETAWELFGSTAVVGDTICIGKAERTIRAVMREPGSSVIVMGSITDLSGGGADAPLFDRITVDSRESEKAEGFLMQNALEGVVLRFDYLRGIGWLPELIPGKWSDFSGWKKNYELKKTDFERMMQVKKNSVELCFESRCGTLACDRALQAVCVWVAVVYFFRSAGQVSGPALYDRLRQKRTSL